MLLEASLQVTGCAPEAVAYWLGLLGIRAWRRVKSPGVRRCHSWDVWPSPVMDGEHQRDVRRCSSRDLPDNDVVVQPSGLAQTAQAPSSPRVFRPSAAGMLYAVIRPDSLSRIRRRTVSGMRTVFVHGLRPTRATDPRMSFLPVHWRLPERNNGYLRPHSRQPE